MHFGARDGYEVSTSVPAAAALLWALLAGLDGLLGFPAGPAGMGRPPEELDPVVPVSAPGTEETIKKD